MLLLVAAEAVCQYSPQLTVMKGSGSCWWVFLQMLKLEQ